MYLKTEFWDDLANRIKMKFYQGFSSDVINQIEIFYSDFNNGYIPIKFPKSLKKMIIKIID